MDGYQPSLSMSLIITAGKEYRIPKDADPHRPAGLPRIVRHCQTQAFCVIMLTMPRPKAADYSLTEYLNRLPSWQLSVKFLYDNLKEKYCQ